MNSHDIKVIKTIIKHISKIIEYTRDCESIEQFKDNAMLSEACVFNLMQIGELAHSELSEEAKGQLKDIPWREIYGMRNRIVHGYSGVSFIIVWDTIKNDLGKLRDELQEALNSLNL